MRYDYPLLQSPLLFNNICNRLKDKFVDLPEEGIIAGQAVASAIYSLIGISDESPYRDLDVFIEKKNLPKQVKEDYEFAQAAKPTSNNSSVKRLQGGVDSKLAKSSYDGIFNPILKNGYVVNDCLFLDNKVNYVLVQYEAVNTKKVDCIVNGFDINCCEAGIDMNDRTVYWTQAFEDFLRSFEIKISNYLTPAHTIVRAAKKASELPFATFNYHSIKQAQTVRKYIQSIEVELEKTKTHKGHFYGHMFSKGYLSRFEKQKAMLGDHFYLAEKTIYVSKIDEKVTFYNLIAKSWDGPLLNLFRVFFKLTKNPKRVEKETSSGYVHLENDLFYINEITKIINSKGWKHAEFLSLIELASSNSLRHEGSQFLFNILFSDKAKLLKAMNESEKIRAAKLIGYHEILGSIQHLNWSVDDTRLLIKNMHRVDKGKYRFIIRKIENAFCLASDDLSIEGIRKPDAYEFIGKKLQWLISDNFKEHLEVIYQDKMNSMDPTVLAPIFDRLIENIDQSAFIISELLCEKDIFFEGVDMQHCVGGYWYEIESGSTFIFSVRNVFDKAKRCTLQLNVGNGGLIKIVQNQTYRNTPPNAELKLFCDAAVKKWNTLLSQSSESVFSFNGFTKTIFQERIWARAKFDARKLPDERQAIANLLHA